MDRYPALISKISKIDRYLGPISRRSRYNEIFNESAKAGFLNLTRFIWKINDYSTASETAVETATRLGHSKIVGYLLIRLPEYGNLAFHCFRGHLEVLKIIFRENDLIDWMRYARSVIHYDHLDSLEWLLSKKSFPGDILISIAARQNHSRILRYLIEIYPYVDKTKALEEAINYGMVENVLILLDSGARFSGKTENPEIQDILSDRGIE